MAPCRHNSLSTTSFDSSPLRPTRLTRRRWPSTATTTGCSQPPLMAVHKKHPKVQTIHEDKARGGGSRKELSDLQFTFAAIFSPAGLLFHHQVLVWKARKFYFWHKPTEHRSKTADAPRASSGHQRRPYLFFHRPCALTIEPIHAQL
ncbi:hypothetical protein ACQJBY_049006 [Aegilops geniculata]